MKKSVIASSMLLALLSGAAQAQVETPTFYGAIRLAVTDADTSFAVNPSGGEGTTIENNFSLVGLKGSASLTETVQLVYKAEAMVKSDDQDNKDGVLSSRDTFIGVKGEAGTLIFGKMGSAFWKAEGGVDQFNLTNTDMGRLFAGNSRYGDMISYTSPRMYNTNVLVSYQLEDDAYGADVNREGSLYSVAVIHGDKALKKTNYFVGFGYNAGLGGDEAYRISGQTKLGQLKLGAVYQDTKDLYNENLDGDGFMVDVAYPLSAKLSLKARYGQDDSGNGKYAGNVVKSLTDVGAADVTDSKVTNYAVGADYKLSKVAKLYGHYSRFEAELDNAAGRQYDDADNIISMGLHYKF
ncbi:porin [uncultured Ferrimonas sp.]|uniref:porin n=1 Tax=uncultured Ferrimonas sp. TaxID=432640 RepID=UPI002611D2BC|nr:porin [uncultured Ferrimonas sp.]